MKKILFLPILLGLFSANAQTNLLPAEGNFNFEGGSPTNAYWWYLNQGSGSSAANFAWQTVEKHGGNAAYQLNVTAAGSQQYHIQVVSSNNTAATYPTLTNEVSYTLQFWMKTTNGSGVVRVSNVGVAPYAADVNITSGSDWKLYSFVLPGNGTTYRPSIDMGQAGVGTYYIDDVALYKTSDLGVVDSSKKKVVSVYPNPAKEVINLDSETYSSSKTVSIFDVSGKAVMTLPVSKTINVSKLAKGTYILTTDKGSSTKFIKE